MINPEDVIHYLKDGQNGLVDVGVEVLAPYTLTPTGRRCTNDSFLQYKRRWPDSVNNSVHYEMRCNGHTVEVVVHVESGTDKRFPCKLVKSRLNGVYSKGKVDCSACTTVDDAADSAKKMLRKIYDVVEPVLMDIESDVVAGVVGRDMVLRAGSHESYANAQHPALDNIALRDLEDGLMNPQGMGRIAERIQDDLRERRSGAFNILEVLGLADYEIRHSFMLAWLLDPSGNHKLGCKFLRSVVDKIIGANEVVDFTALRDLGSDGAWVQVDREVEDMDIVVEDRQNKVVLVIENKWDAAEREDTDDQLGQLKKYYAQIQRRYKTNLGWRAFFVFLSPTGRPPSESNRDIWGVMSYGDVLSCLNGITAHYPMCDDSGVETLIRHYEKIVERKVRMENKEFLIQCEEFYQKHKAIIDYIVEHVDRRHPVLARLAKGVEAESICGREVLRGECNANVYVQFKRRMPASSGQSVHYEVIDETNKGGIAVVLHIEKLTESSLRSKIIQTVHEMGVNGFTPIQNGVRRLVPSKNQEIDRLYEEVRKSLCDLYAQVEPMLRRFEDEKESGSGEGVVNTPLERA